MIQARFIIETQGNKKNDVENVMKKHVEDMKHFKGVKVYDVKFERTEEVDGLFSSLADIGIKTKEFEPFFAAMLGFAPTAIVFESTDPVTISIAELQNVTNDVMQLFHLIAQKNLQLRLQLDAAKR
jgi:hypothetical protein